MFELTMKNEFLKSLEQIDNDIIIVEKIRHIDHPLITQELKQRAFKLKIDLEVEKQVIIDEDLNPLVQKRIDEFLAVEAKYKS